jgi:RNA polymerase sigma-70 factor (ECF subfamily)
VDEIVQRSWTQAHRDLPRLATPDAFRAWLWGITRHELYDARRRQQREQARSVLVPPTDGILELFVDTCDSTDAFEDMDGSSVDAILSVLPARQRRIVIERGLEDRAPAEVAERLGLSASTVYSEFSRGISRLKATIGSAQAVIVPWLAVRLGRRPELMPSGSETLLVVAAALTLLVAPATDHGTDRGRSDTNVTQSRNALEGEPSPGKPASTAVRPAVTSTAPTRTRDDGDITDESDDAADPDATYETVVEVPGVVGVGRDGGDVDPDDSADLVVRTPTGGETHVWIWDTIETESPDAVERLEVG